MISIIKNEIKENENFDKIYFEIFNKKLKAELHLKANVAIKRW